MEKDGKAGTNHHAARMPSVIDFHVGQRIRQRRTELNITQEKFANDLGIAFQQVQKYERGINRTSAGRLFEIALILRTDYFIFFRGCGRALHKEVS